MPSYLVLLEVSFDVVGVMMMAKIAAQRRKKSAYSSKIMKALLLWLFVLSFSNNVVEGDRERNAVIEAAERKRRAAGSRSLAGSEAET